MVRRKGNNVMNFNKEQLEVINHKDGTCVVIAGAGSGKSTVSVHRVKKLIEGGVDEKDILVSSFSSKSATDLKNKLSKVVLGFGILKSKTWVLTGSLPQLLVIQTSPQCPCARADLNNAKNSA